MSIDTIVNIVSATGTIVALVALVYQFIKDRKYDTEKQAKSVATWVVCDMTERNTAIIFIRNMSDLPIYEVVVSRDMVFEGKYEERNVCDKYGYIQTIPPGLYSVEILSDGGCMNRKFNASITFRDSGGKYWHRNAGGYLKAIGLCSVEYRHLERPVSQADIVKVE